MAKRISLTRRNNNNGELELQEKRKTNGMGEN
jgi:hypothetical protein